MDFADDVAYSVHDLEDGIVGGRIDLEALDRREERQATWATVRDWYLPDATDDDLEETFRRLRAVGSWPGSSYDGSRRALASLKNLTSDLIGIFCGSVHQATEAAHGAGPLVRHRGDVVVPDETAHEIAVLKGIAAHYVMRAQDRLDLMERQRTLLHELFEAIWKRGSDGLDDSFRPDFDDATDDAARTRVVIDQIASLTDALGAHPARRPRVRWPGLAREAGAMTSRNDPLVWLPFDPELLGEVPDNLRYEQIDPDDLPASADEVEFYVLRLPLPSRRRRGAGDAAEAAGRADADGRRRAHPGLRARGRAAVQRTRHPRHLDRRARGRR